MPIKIIIDTDPGVDDAIALIAALTSPDIDVVGITSIGGNFKAVETQRNALGICALVGRTDVPVYAGLDEPLQRKQIEAAGHVHGEDGVKGLILPMDKVAAPQTDKDAVEFILSETRKHQNDPLTLVAIGPMTNIATAYLRDPTLPMRVKEVVAMSGAHGNPSGNVTPYAEFNVLSDPHAANIVYGNFPRIRAFPLDVTLQTLQGPEFRQWLSGLGATGKNIATMLENHAATYPGLEDTGTSPVHDFHTISALVHPGLYGYKTGRVQITETGEREGQTTLVPDANGSTSVAVSIDRDEFFTCLTSMLEQAASR